MGFDELDVGDIVRERHLPQLQPRAARALLMHIRVVKTPGEVEALVHAARLNQAALEETLATIQEGADVANLATTFRRAVATRGGMPAPHGGYLSGSAERAVAARHHHVLRKGDVLFAGAVSTFNSYYSDFLRTYVVGPPTPAQARAHRLLEMAFAHVTPLLKPGMNSGEPATALFRAIEREGGNVHNVGLNVHTMGLEIVEVQHPVGQKGFLLEPNVCFCLYLLYKSPEDGNIFSIEHNYMVTQDGCQQLDTLPDRLIEVG
jgi:Xaa-Pro aminopeptidase